MRRERIALLAVLCAALLGLAFASGTEGAFERVLGRDVRDPSSIEPAAERQLNEPDDADVPVALAATAELAPENDPAPADGATTRTEEIVDAVAAVTSAQPTPETTTTAPAPQESQVAAAGAAPTTSPERTTSGEASADEPTSTTTTAAPAASPTTTTTAAPQTTAAPTTSAAPASTATPTHTAGGWVSPSNTGHRRTNLLDFPGPNDGPHGVTIDADFLDAHSGAAWLAYDGGRPIISGINADGRCLNILVTLTLRDSYVNCPTRTQNNSWGYAGEVDDAPAVNILGATNVVVEHNTITCSGHDGDICSRSVRVGGRDALVQYNDLSLARGAVSLFHGTVFRYNYAHDLAFGFDPTRASNPSDNVTHNNVVNNLGYTNILVQGNYIVARYGRVSSSPSTYRNPHFHGVYSNGVVEVGDPINGFAFTNYLVNGNGDGLRVRENYVEGSGRPFRCNASSRHSGASCVDDMSGNVFAEDRFDDFNPPLFHDKDGAGSISGSCNLKKVGGGYELLPSDAFGPGNVHGHNNC